MDAWFLNDLHDETTIITSESGYSNDEIGVKVLEHFIKCTKLSPWSSLISSTSPILLLLDGHGSHCTEEFKALASQNNIILHQFPAHLTHIIQPLDVGCFHIWKHFHNLAIHQALHNLQNVYNTAAFLRDLPEIRMKTLTLSNVVSAFQKSGIWPPDINTILKRMNKFAISKPSKPQAPNSITSNSELPSLLSSSKSILNKTPCNAVKTVKVGNVLKKKVDPHLSSPSRKAFDNFISAAGSLVYQAEL